MGEGRGGRGVGGGRGGGLGERTAHPMTKSWLRPWTDWRLEVNLGQLNDWRRLAVSMTGDGDFASALLFVTVSYIILKTPSRL